MNLYLVTCAIDGSQSSTYIQIYVATSNISGAEKEALKLAENLYSPFIYDVISIELLASVNTHKAKHLLVIDNGLDDL